MSGPQERKPHKPVGAMEDDGKRKRSDSYHNSTFAKAMNQLAPDDRPEAKRAHSEAMADLLIKEDVFIKNKSQLLKEEYSNMLNKGNKLGSAVVTQTYDYYLAKRAKLVK